MKVKHSLILCCIILLLGSKYAPINSIKSVKTSIDTINIRTVNFKPSCTQQEWNEIIKIANEIGTSPQNIHWLIMHESKFNPQAINPYTNAVGLIQFMPSTISKLGYT